MINIAICDDEKYISDKVKKLALDFFHRKNVEIKNFTIWEWRGITKIQQKYRYFVFRYSNGWHRWYGNCKKAA